MISNFDDLLQIARSEGQPQSLLFVFLTAQIEADATAEQRAAFDQGEGGVLVPLMCVDKRPQDIASFEQFSAQADTMNSTWTLVLAGALSGIASAPPSDSKIDEIFQRWLAQIQNGQMEQVIAQTVAFSRTGQAVSLMN